MFTPAVLSAVALLVPTPDLRPYVAFAERLETAIRDGDEKAYPGLFDSDALNERLFRLVKAPAEFRRNSIVSIRDAWPQTLRTYADGVQAGGLFGKVRVHVRGPEVWALYRYIEPDGRVDYTDFILGTSRGEVRVIDMQRAVSGEPNSRAMAPMVARMVREQARRAGGNVPADGSSANLERMKTVQQLLADGRPREALNEFDRLPVEVKKTSPFLLIRLGIIGHLTREDPPSYLRYLDDHRRQYPGDPAAELAAIDELRLRKRFADARRAVDRLNAAIGGDLYLFALRAELFVSEGRPLEARWAAQVAAWAVPASVHPEITLANAAVLSRDYKEAVLRFIRIEIVFNRAVGDLRMSPMYADFVKSPEYLNWQAARTTK